MSHPNKDLALIGAGYWGKNLARNFHALGVLHTICDSSAQVLAGYGAEYAGVAKSDSVVAVLADPSVAKVAIAAPAALHYALVREALNAGKDVYVEKPLCLDVGEAEALVALAARLGKILMVGHLLQYHPCVAELQRMVGRGELGRVQYITSNRLNLGKFRQEENALWSFAPHDVSVILSLVGNRLPEEVRCVGESYLTPSVADTTLTSFRFAENVRAHVYVSWLNPFKEQKLTVVGSRGMVVFDDTQPWAQKLIIHRDYLTWTDGRTPTASKVGGVPVSVPEAEPLRQECEHFVTCCRERTAPRTDGREGVRVLQVLKAAQRSLDRGGDAVAPAASAAPAYFAHPTSVIGDGAAIGAGTKIWHFSHVMAGARVGEDCNLGQNVVISPGVVLGRNVKIQNNVSVYAGTVVEDNVFLGPSCVFTNVSNPRSEINRRGLYEATLIQRGATIGANATVLCGTKLGRYCFIAAGAVVTKDVPDYALMVGAPARQKGWMSRHGRPLKERDANGDWVCPESGYHYRLDAAGQLRCLDLDEQVPLPPAMAVGKLPYRAPRS